MEFVTALFPASVVYILSDEFFQLEPPYSVPKFAAPCKPSLAYVYTLVPKAKVQALTLSIGC